jgi:stage II sporulation protein P
MKVKQMAVFGLVVFLTTSMITFISIGKSYGESLGFSANASASVSIGLTEEEVGKIFVGAVFPTISRGVGRIADSERLSDEEADVIKDEVIQDEADAGAGDTNTGVVIDTQNPELQEPEAVNAPFEDPLVIIYHTHATEAYQPITIGNFHTTEEEGTVREIGAIMVKELEKLGIKVVHDKTLHNYPSYSQSYNRSLETAQGLMRKYPTAIFVIDLHRDAASYMGNVGSTVLVNGETTATYSLVIGKGNANANALRTYANKIHIKAEEMFPGFGGRNIEKPYRFNQYISDYHILLEIGNNQNNIKEARNTAKYFSQVLAEVIKDIKQ